MEASGTGRDSGPYRDGSKKFVKAVFCMIDGKEFTYSKRDITKDFNTGFVEYVAEIHDKVDRLKSVRLSGNHEMIALVQHIKYVRFETHSE